MNDLKDKLPIVYAIIGLGIMYAAITYAGAYARSIQPSSFRSFSVSGEGKVVVVPDVAKVSFSVTTEGGKDLATINTENTNQYNKIVDFLKGKNIPKEDIETTQSSVNPRYQTYNCYQTYSPTSAVRPCPPSEIVGYTVKKSVSVKIRDFAKIGEVMAGVVDNGANEVSGLNFTIDDRSKAENEAREEAIKQAKEKAETIAKAGGFRLGNLLSIDENSVRPYYDMPMMATEAYGLGGATKASPAPSIEPGSDEISVNVYLRYEIR